MAMDLTASLRASISINASETREFDNPSTNPVLSFAKSLASGTGVGYANQAWWDYRTIAASSNDDIDLRGSLTDAFCNTINFTKIKAILVINESQNATIIDGHATATAAEVQVGGTVANQVTGIFADNSDAIKLASGSASGQGGAFFWFDSAGKTVTAGTADILRITNNTAAQCLYGIMIVGER